MSGFDNWLKKQQQFAEQTPASSAPKSGFENWLAFKANGDKPINAAPVKNPMVSLTPNLSSLEHKSVVEPASTGEVLRMPTSKETQAASSKQLAYNNKFNSRNPLDMIENWGRAISTTLAGNKEQKSKMYQQNQLASQAQNSGSAPVTPGGAAFLGFANSATLGALKPAYKAASRVTATPNYYEQDLMRTQQEHPTASVIGTMAGYAAPGSAVDRGISLAARPILERAGATLAGRIASGAATGAISNAAIAGISDKLQGANSQQSAKDVAVQGLVGAVLGGAGAVAPEIMGAVRNATLSPSERAARVAESSAMGNAAKTFSLGQSFPTDASAPVNTPVPKVTLTASDMQKLHSNPLYEEAAREWDDAMEQIHNHFQTAELTPVEEAGIQPELGIDVNALMDKLEAADKLNRMSPEERLRWLDSTGVMDYYYPDEIAKYRAVNGENSADLAAASMAPSNVTGGSVSEETGLNNARSTVDNQAGDGLQNSVGAKAADFPYQENTSKFYSNTIENSPMFTQAEKDIIAENAPQYQVITEQQSLREAQQRLQTDFEGEVKRLSEDRQLDGTDLDAAMGIMKRFAREGRYAELKTTAGQIGEKATQAGQFVQGMAKYSRTPEGLIVSGVKQVNDEAANMLEGKVGKTPLGQKIDQKTNLIESILKRPNAEHNIQNVLGGDKDTASKVMKMFQDGEYTRQDISNILKEKYKVPVLTDDDMAQISDAMEKWANESDPKLKDAYVDQAAKVIASRLPASFWDKADAWRFTSMLLNFKTHERNIIGNTAMDLLRREKNLFGIVGEKLIPVSERTKAILTGADKPIQDFAAKDYTEMEGLLRQESKLDFQSAIQKNRRIFNTGALEWLRKMGIKTLDAEDLWFVKGAYTDSLAQVIKARKLNPEFLMSDAGKNALDSARQWAMQEALRSTFHENSKIAGYINLFQNKNLATRVAVGGVLPFKKTPINILKQGVRYSPAGLLKGLLWDSSQLRAGNITASQYIDNLSMGLSGSSIALLGGWLMSKGIITVSTNAKGKAAGFEGQTGSQNYALVLNVGGHKFTYTIDWITPACIPFFLGAEIYNSMNQQTGKNAAQKALTTFSRFADAMSKVSDPLMNLSMLQGVASTLQSAAYSKSYGEMANSLIGGAVSGYAGQFVPTALGQVARTITPYEKSTYSQTAPGKVLDTAFAKIPGVNLSLPNYIDQWGRPVSQGDIAQRTALNLFSPGYLSEANTNKVNAEVERLYQATGNSAALPPVVQNTVEYNGTYYELSPKEKERYATTMGRAAANGLKSMIGGATYKAAKDYVKGNTPDKLGMVSKVYTNAAQQAKAEFLRRRGIHMSH